MTAQMNSDQVPEPIQCPMPLTEAGIGTASACEVVLTRPSRMKPVPSVVMNDGSPTETVRKPLTQPTARPMSSETMMASQPGKP